MDDYPAGPTSPGPRRPPLSVVIPVRNGGPNFERCLLRLRDSSWTDFELVVVDDDSTDGSAKLAESFGARVVRHTTRTGPAAARNTGAEAATAPLVFFLDADVALHRDTLAKAIARFEREPDVAALFGSYDDDPPARGLVSQFRNLLHHYIHQRGEFTNGARPVHTFWTGCGAIRRQVFLDLGGFDPHLYRRPAIEDIELGYRITRAGLRIELLRDMQATHLKGWSLTEMLGTDIFRRGVPWMLLLKRSRTEETDLNVSQSQKLCVALTGLAIVSCVLGFWKPLEWAITLICLAIIVGLNSDFYRFLARRRGSVFAWASLPLHLLYYCSCGLSVVIALALWHASGLKASAAQSDVLAQAGARGDAPEPVPAQPKSAAVALGQNTGEPVRALEGETPRP